MRRGLRPLQPNSQQHALREGLPSGPYDGSLGCMSGPDAAPGFADHMEKPPLFGGHLSLAATLATSTHPSRSLYSKPALHTLNPPLPLPRARRPRWCCCPRCGTTRTDTWASSR